MAAIRIFSFSGFILLSYKITLNMTEEQIFSRWLAMVGNDKRYPGHAEALEVTKFWSAMATGKSDKVVEATLRVKESNKQKKVRKRVNNSSTRYVTEKIKTTYREVDRCDSIKENIEHKDPEALKIIHNRADNFFGNQDLDSFNDDFLLHYSISDPNGFMLVNIKDHDANVEKPECYPTIIETKNVRDYVKQFNEIRSLAFQQGAKDDLKIEHLWTATYVYTLTPAKFGQPNESSELVQVPKRAHLDVYVWTPHEERKGTFIDIKIPQASTDIKESKEHYYLTRYAHNLGFVPVIQFGIVRSFEHEHTIYESLLLPAKERYIELHQKKSTYDVHLAVHGIAKEIAYVPTCNYVDNKTQIRCNGGSLAGQFDEASATYKVTDCPKCKGSGKMPIHKSELDIITIEIPLGEGALDTEIVDVSKLHQYIEIPQHIIEMHKKAADEAATDVALAMFNTNVFKRAELTAATATEVIQNNKSIDNALYAYGQHRGRIKEFQLRCIAAYTDYEKGFTCSIKYPSDYKLETEDELYQRRKLALDSGVGANFLKCIDRDILAKQNANDPDRVKYITAVDGLKPFNGDTESERISLFTLLPKDHPKRLAMLYFDDVIFYLDTEKKTKNKWYKLPEKSQKELFNDALEAVTQDYEERTPKAEPINAPLPPVAAQNVTE